MPLRKNLLEDLLPKKPAQIGQLLQDEQAGKDIHD